MLKLALDKMESGIYKMKLDYEMIYYFRMIHT